MSAFSMAPYRRAQAVLDAVLAAVPRDRWDTPSACTEWTVRDVAGHLVWGQEQLRHWALDVPYTEMAGAPGAPHPAPLAGEARPRFKFESTDFWAHGLNAGLALRF